MVSDEEGVEQAIEPDKVECVKQQQQKCESHNGKSVYGRQVRAMSCDSTFHHDTSLNRVFIKRATTPVPSPPTPSTLLKLEKINK